MPLQTPAAESAAERQPVLDTVERVCELCFGLFMALTFVGIVSATTTEPEPGKLMFITALGCNLAWGLADAVMFLVRTLTDRGRRLSLALAVRAADAASGVSKLRGELGPAMRTLVDDVELEAIRKRLAAVPTLPDRPRFQARDFAGAAGVFAMVVLGTFPVALPFVLFADAKLALLVSRILTLAMLFAAGIALGRHAGYGGWRSGLAMTIVGVLLTAAIIALGG